MTANVTFIIDSRDDVLRVPTAALRYKPAGAAAPQRKRTGDRSGSAKKAASRAAGDDDTRQSRQRRTVWVLAGGKPQPRRITVGLSDGTHVEVLEGELSVSDKLITALLDGKVAAASPQKKSPSPRRGGRGRIF
jgi:HlyD family secretion protein